MKTYRHRLRGDIAADWTADNPVLLLDEPGVEHDTGRMKLGDGGTAWADLPYLDEMWPGGGGDEGDLADLAAADAALDARVDVLEAGSAGVAHLTGAETFTGVKTFEVSDTHFRGVVSGDGNDAYGQFRFQVRNPDAPVPNKNLYAFGFEAAYQDDGTFVYRDFYIFDYVTNNYLLIFTAAGDVEVGTLGAGIIIKSPDGTRYRVTVANGGALVTTAV